MNTISMTSSQRRSQLEGWSLVNFPATGCVDGIDDALTADVTEALARMVGRPIGIVETAGEVEVRLHPSDHACRHVRETSTSISERGAVKQTITRFAADSAAVAELLAGAAVRQWMDSGDGSSRGMRLAAGYVASWLGVAAQAAIGDVQPQTPYLPGFVQADAFTYASLLGASNGGCAACELALTTWIEPTLHGEQRRCITMYRRALVAAGSEWFGDRDASIWRRVETAYADCDSSGVWERLGMVRPVGSLAGWRGL